MSYSSSQSIQRVSRVSSRIKKSYYILTQVKQKTKKLVFQLAFQLVRRLRAVSPLRQVGLPICRAYLPINTAKTEGILTQSCSFLSFQRCLGLNSETTLKPLTVSGQNLESLRPLRAAIETILLDVEDSKFSFRNYHLLDPDLNIIDENCYELYDLPISRQILTTPRRIKGTVAYLTNAAPSNYYHWMCRILPVLKIYQEHWGLQSIDHFYVGNASLNHFQRESLEKANIPLSKIVHHACQPDRLLAAIPNRTFFSGSAPINQQYYQYSRQLFQDVWNQPVEKKNRIYVTRGTVTRRSVLNETDVLSFLEQEYGFKAVAMDGKSIAQQAALFAGAEIVVAPHGAALTNLLFAQPSMKVIELIPNGYTNNCFYALANYAEARYGYLVGEDTNQSYMHTHWRDIYIDIEKLKALIQIMIHD